MQWLRTYRLLAALLAVVLFGGVASPVVHALCPAAQAAGAAEPGAGTPSAAAGHTPCHPDGPADPASEGGTDLGPCCCKLGATAPADPPAPGQRAPEPSTRLQGYDALSAIPIPEPVRASWLPHRTHPPSPSPLRAHLLFCVFLI